MVRRIAFLGSCVTFGAAQIDPQFSQRVTVYHVNPAKAGSIPINMDTGDELGDLYFYLGQFLLPIECTDPHPKGEAKWDCTNTERFGPTVVTKVSMEFDNRWTQYSGCNYCNGTTVDPFTGKTCKEGTYICDCFNWDNRSDTCDSTKVGRSASYFAPHEGCHKGAKDYVCWQVNVQNKISGLWFSTLKDGMCNQSSRVGECSWKVKSASTVNSTCLDDSLMTKVEAANPKCFEALGPRNQSSPAWIGCFMDTILGPNARNETINYTAMSKTYGMHVNDLVDAWKQPFLDEAAGGCPKIPDPAFYQYIV